MLTYTLNVTPTLGQVQAKFLCPNLTPMPSLFPVSSLWTELINTQVFLLAKEIWYGEKWGQGKPSPSPYEWGFSMEKSSHGPDTTTKLGNEASRGNCKSNT